MELPITVTDGGVERDLLVRCDPSLPVGDLVSAMTGQLNGGISQDSPTVVPVYLGSRRLDAAMSVGRAGLLPGAVLAVGGAGTGDRSGAGVTRYELAIVGGLVAGPAVALPEGTLTIGRGARCDVVLRDEETSRLHASITTAGDAVTIEDLHSSNGTSVNGTADRRPDRRPTRRSHRDRRLDPHGAGAGGSGGGIGADRRRPSPLQQATATTRHRRGHDIRAAREAREGARPPFQPHGRGRAPPDRHRDRRRAQESHLSHLQLGVAGDARRQLPLRPAQRPPHLRQADGGIRIGHDHPDGKAGAGCSR